MDIFGKLNGGPKVVSITPSAIPLTSLTNSISDAPGGPAGDWTDLGACTSSKRSVVQRAPEAGINPVQRRNLRFARDQI
jgi:hypothetical protein